MKNFILAMRPKTLLAGIIPPIVAFTYFYGQTGRPEFFYLLMCVLGAVFIQIATNFFNDVIDHEKGADEKRVGPTRVTASGLVPKKTVLVWAYTCVGLALLCGIPVVIRGGWAFLVLGLISLYLSYGYTGGKISLAYRGLGELFVFLFFGLFSVMGSYYLFALELNFKIFNLAAIFGLLATTFIAVNNLRDRETDLAVGKMTMATRYSPGIYKIFVLSTIFVPYLLLHFYRENNLTYFVFLALIPGIKLGSIILTKSGSELNEGLKFSAIHLLVFSILLSLSFTYARLF